MRIGIVSPYSFDVPGGVQRHVHDLADTLIGLGHEVSVLAPADEDSPHPAYVVPAGRAVPVRYNGSVARLAFGPLSAARVRRWITANDFDVLHVHEPFTPSLSMLAVLSARDEPVVATFHTAMARSRALYAASGMLQLVLERITARIAVSPAARKVQVEHLGGGATEIPNGVAVARYARATPLEGWPGEGAAIGFVGRFTEPRKGFAVLAQAFARISPSRPGLRLLVAGPGDPAEAVADLPADIARQITFLGLVSEEEKARALRGMSIYVAPNTGGESFGMVLTEALAAGAPVVASDLEAFRYVIEGGASPGLGDPAGVLVPVGDSAALAMQLERLLDDPAARDRFSRRGTEVVGAYDWSVVAGRVCEVYQTAVEVAPRATAAQGVGASRPIAPVRSNGTRWGRRGA
jgi:phosphatidylinositol alpha-mannosyltransferase